MNLVILTCEASLLLVSAADEICIKLACLTVGRRPLDIGVPMDEVEAQQ